MNNILKPLFALSAILLMGPSIIAQQIPKDSIFLFTKTKPNNIHRPAIEAGIKALKKIGKQNNLFVTVSDDPEDFNITNLSKYGVIVLINAGPRVLDSIQKKAFKQYILSGGGFVGVHSIADRNWPWYMSLIGGSEMNHPEPQEATVTNTSHDNSSFYVETDSWIIKDEFYNFSNIQEDINVVLSIDEGSYLGGEVAKNHPVCWYREYDGGRSFYLALGHFSYHYSNKTYLNYLEKGIRYAFKK